MVKTSPHVLIPSGGPAVTELLLTYAKIVIFQKHVAMAACVILICNSI